MNREDDDGCAQSIDRVVSTTKVSAKKDFHVVYTNRTGLQWDSHYTSYSDYEDFMRGYGGRLHDGRAVADVFRVLAIGVKPSEVRGIIENGKCLLTENQSRAIEAERPAKLKQYDAITTANQLGIDPEWVQLQWKQQPPSVMNGEHDGVRPESTDHVDGTGKADAFRVLAIGVKPSEVQSIIAEGNCLPSEHELKPIEAELAAGRRVSDAITAANRLASDFEWLPKSKLRP